MEIQLSIIVPIYNCEKYLKRCIDSLLEQELEKYEIILIDDGSTDGSANICDSYYEKCDNIIVIHKKNEGQGIARNLGIEIAKGKYISFVDSDDYINKNAYKGIIALMEEKKSDIYIGQIKVCREFELAVEENNNSTNTVRQYISDEKIDVLNTMLNNQERENCGFNVSSSSCDKIYLKELIFDNVKFPTERKYISEDIIFNFEAIKSAKSIIVSNMYFYNYIQNENSFCHTYHPDYFERMKNMRKYFDSYIIKEGNQEIFNKLINIKIFSYLKSCIIQEVNNKKIFRARKAIKKICNDKYVYNLINSIEYKDLDKNNKVMLWIIKNKLYLIIYLLYKIKL